MSATIETDMKPAPLAIPQGGELSFIKPGSAEMPRASHYRHRETNGRLFHPQAAGHIRHTRRLGDVIADIALARVD
jgi:hypothetical protein